MQLEVGKIYEGKVTGITKFGAFVEIDPKITGMVHISEIANTFVNEIKDFITEGQMVKVKVLAITDDKKISLSIKKADENYNAEKQHSDNKTGNGDRPRKFNNSDKPRNTNNRPPRQPVEYKKPQPAGPASFEEMLSKFKQNSEEKMSDIKKNMDNKRRNSSRRSSVKM